MMPETVQTTTNVLIIYREVYEREIISVLN